MTKSFYCFCHRIDDIDPVCCRLKAYDEAKAAGKASPAKEVEKLGYRGFYRCCVYKWAKCRQVQHWDLLVTTAPQLAKRMKELPNKVRKMIGQPLKFVSRISGMNLEEKGTTILPPELAEMVAEAVATCR